VLARSTARVMEPDAKQAKYEAVLRELEGRFSEVTDLVARMATAAALLHGEFDHFFWTGFYRLVDGELTVGPYQGFPACMVLERHRGVCWAGIDRGQVVNVPNVHEFEGHIACDGRANSEIVVPLRDPSGKIIGVLDVDSGDFDAFDAMDGEYLALILTRLWI